MNLSRKTFFYTLSLAALIIAFVVLYLIIFIPSLYVEYSYERQANMITQRHLEFLENKEYDSTKSNSAVFTTTISIDENNLDKIYYYNLNFSSLSFVFLNKRCFSYIQVYFFYHKTIYENFLAAYNYNLNHNFPQMLLQQLTPVLSSSIFHTGSSFFRRLISSILSAEPLFHFC